MADISQITQELTQFGSAPDSLDPATFNQRADATVAHLHTHVTEQNAVGVQINKVTREINERASDLDNKYDEIVEKHTDFIPKYNDAVEKHGQIVTMHAEVEADTSHVDTLKNEIDTIKTHIDQTKNQIDTDLATAKSLINDGNGGIIDDAKTSAVSTWSSEKLENAFDKKVGVDDNTVSILNLKILKEKTEQNPPETAEILFRTQSGQSFEVAGLNQLYGTMKGYIEGDFAINFAKLYSKIEPIDIEVSSQSDLLPPNMSFETEDGSIILVYVPARIFQNKLLRVSSTGEFSALDMPSVPDAYFFVTHIVFENGERQLYIAPLKSDSDNPSMKKLYKLNKAGSGSWSEITNPEGLDFGVCSFAIPFLMGTKKTSARAFNVYKKTNDTWELVASNRNFPSSAEYETGINHLQHYFEGEFGYARRLNLPSFYDSLQTSQMLVYDFGYKEEGSTGIKFFPDRRDRFTNTYFLNEETFNNILFIDENVVLSHENTYMRIRIKDIKNKKTYYKQLEEPVLSIHSWCLLWLKIGGSYISVLKDDNSRKFNKFTLNSKILKPYNIEGF